MSSDGTPRRGGGGSGRGSYRSQRASSGRGGRGGRGRGRGGNRSSRGSNRNKTVRQQGHATMSDEEVLVCFAPLLRAKDPGAVSIHQQYTISSSPGAPKAKGSEQKAFVEAVRQFLLSRQQRQPHAMGYERKNSGGVSQGGNERKEMSIPASYNIESHNKQPEFKRTSNDYHSGTKAYYESHKKVEYEELEDTKLTDEMSSVVKAVTDLIEGEETSASTPISLSSAEKSTKLKPSEHVNGEAQSQTRSISSVNESFRDELTIDTNRHQQNWPSTSAVKNEESKPMQDGKGQESTFVKKDQTYKTQTPKRLIRNQPGVILANGVRAPSILKLQPRQELTARWSIPLAYLRARVLQKSESTNPPNITVRDALESLSVGLFRRGCPENGTDSSIVSKEVMSCSSDQKQFHFAIDSQTETVWGEVPFYSPRSPGNIVFRLYFENDTLQTMATGPTIVVDVQSSDVEPTLRFILANFKSKKGSGLSSMYSLSIVLDSFRPPPSTANTNQGMGSHQQQRAAFEGAGRAAWGCVCESRKAMQAAEEEYKKRKDKVLKAEEELLKVKEDNEKNASGNSNEPEKDDGVSADNMQAKSDANDEETAEETTGDPKNDSKKDSSVNKEEQESKNAPSSKERWREKMNALLGEKASIERKWREVQSAYASILRAALRNNSCSLLLRRDLVTKLRLEFELWCPLCECFSPNPFIQQNDSSTTDNFPFPHPINTSHFQLCAKSRAETQLAILGFIPRTETLHQLLHSPSTKQYQNKSSASNASHTNDNGAYTMFQRLTASMHKLYSDSLSPNAEFYSRRDSIMSHMHEIVNKCNEFPRGTTVVVFGSSANGFGSSHSDIDMCIHLPENATILSDSDKTGSKAMSKLAEELQKAGMRNVNTTRLTARIPIIKFNYPYRVTHGSLKPHASSSPNISGSAEDGEGIQLIECDISMQNKLATLNTSLLLMYSSIDPRVRVLAAIIKHWTKLRDINDPARHTLSSYGYLLMMLHFLTRYRGAGNAQGHFGHGQPLLPNLQWMDPNWLATANVSHGDASPSPRSNTTGYRELPAKPCHHQLLMQHPTEPNFVINTYFYRPADQQSMSKLQRLFAGSNRTSVGMLFASFLRYYAYEFDYKKYVVSLNSTFAHVEKEAKGESDGWKLYGGGGLLAIEDPFETFYDVAHVLKASSFQRIRREFALAYSKIVDAATAATLNVNDSAAKQDASKTKALSGDELIEWICELVK